jgi:hypothetical protein
MSSSEAFTTVHWSEASGETAMPRWILSIRQLRILRASFQLEFFEISKFGLRICGARIGAIFFTRPGTRYQPECAGTRFLQGM